MSILYLRNSTSYGLANTASFRRASKKLFKRWGSNLQNPSKGALEIYVCKPGRKMIQCDQAGAEALIVAYLTPKGKFRELFLNGIKSHTYVASHIFKDKWRDEYGCKDIRELNLAPISLLPSLPSWKSLAKVIKNSEREYFIGKKSCHSFNYRMKPGTFREDVLKESEGEVALSKIEAEIFHTIYHELFPEISQEWWPEIEHQAKTTGYLFNLFGFPFHCMPPFTEKTLRELTAIVPQSTVGCITATAFANMQEYIENHNRDWHILNDKHDSIAVDVPESEALEAGNVLKSFIEIDLMSPRGEPFKMKSELSIGDNWGKFDPIKNPGGMKEVA